MPREKKKAPPLEKVIVAQIVKALKTAGVCWVMKTHGSPFQMAGVPDVLCISPKRGRFVGIEVKRPDGYGVVSDLQKAQIQKIKDAGGVAGLAYCVEDALALIGEADSEE